MPLELVPKRTALVLIDLQKGIVGMDTVPHSAESVVENGRRLATAFRKAGSLVVLVNVGFRDNSDRLNPPIDSPQQAGSLTSDWAELVLEAEPADLLITKRQWGAFYGTELDLQLRRRGINTIVLGGIATSFGVESTARNAFELGYGQVFVEDATSNRDLAAHRVSFETIFPRMGRVRSTQDVLDALKA